MANNISTKKMVVSDTNPNLKIIETINGKRGGLVQS
jgi:hypothetical protein